MRLHTNTTAESQLHTNLPLLREKVKLLATVSESIDNHSFNIKGLSLKFADELRNSLKECQMRRLV